MASDKVTKRTRDIYERLLDGYNRKELHSHIIFHYPELKTVNSRNRAIQDAYDYAEVEAFKDKEYTFHTHIDRYEKMYADSLVMEDGWGRPLDPKEDWHIMVARYSNALKALKMKEQLLGLHDKNVAIEINNRTASVITTKEEKRGVLGGFDFNKLTLQEKKDLLELLKATRKPIDGVLPVLIKQNEVTIIVNGEVLEEETVEDVEYEELPDEVVTKFKKGESPQEQKHPIDALKEDASSPDDVVAKLHEAAKDEFLRAIRNRKNNI